MHQILILTERGFLCTKKLVFDLASAEQMALCLCHLKDPTHKLKLRDGIFEDFSTMER